MKKANSGEAMAYGECLERMAPYMASAENEGSEVDREMYLALRAATALAFGLDEQTVEAEVRASAGNGEGGGR